jgi:hypothetical protein
VRAPAAVAVAVLAVLALPAAGAPGAPAPAGTAVSAGPYTGVAVGTLDRFRRIRNSQFTSNSSDLYRGRFTYSFQIDAFGNVTGTGTGAYLAASWHLDGVNDGRGFSCDVPIQTEGFGVRVTGAATDAVIRLRFALVGSRERNDDHPCGANFTGFASDGSRLADSLELAQPADGIVIDRAAPRIAPLSKLEVVGDDSDRRVNLHEWAFTIAAPGAPPPPEPPPPGSSGGPAPVRLVGTVGPGARISLTLAGRPVRILPARAYEVEVRDRTRTGNFHLTGPGVDRRTVVRRTGTVRWNVVLRSGTYRFVSDPQATRLRGTFVVR